MIGFLIGADVVAAPERTNALLVPCHGCLRPVHIADSEVRLVHFHGAECMRRGQERDRRYVDALDGVFAFGISVLGCLAALGVALLLMRAAGFVGPEIQP